MAELERQLESTHRESQDRVVEATAAWAERLRVVERATTAERGLEAVNARQAKTEVGLQTSLADTEVAL